MIIHTLCRFEKVCRHHFLSVINKKKIIASFAIIVSLSILFQQNYNARFKVLGATTQGTWGNSASFSGNSRQAIITINGNDQNTNLGNEFTIEGWYQEPQQFQYNGDIMSSVVPSYDVSQGNFRLFIDQPTYGKLTVSLTCGYNCGKNYYVLHSQTNFLTGQSYFFTIQRHNSTLSLYINGLLQDQNTSMYYTMAPLDTFTIGALTTYSSGNTNFLTGGVEEVRVSTIARYPGAVNFNPPTSPFINDSYTKMLYHFDQNTGDSLLTDSSGNGFNGVISGNLSFVNSFLSGSPPTPTLTTPSPSPIPESKPIASFDANPISGPSPLKVRFTNKSYDPDGDTLTYQWTFVDIGESTEPNPTTTFVNNSTGQENFLVVLQVTDPKGNVGTDFKYISVLPAPTPTITPTPTPITCNRADINKDGVVDSKDVTILLADFLSTSPTNPRADINADGIVDITDYSILVANYLSSTGPCQ